MPRFKITMTPKNGGELIVETLKGTSLDRVQGLASLMYAEFNILQIEREPNIYEKQVIAATLDSGREVHLLNFSFKLTYGNWLEGEPEQFMNEEMLVDIERNFAQNHMPTYVRQPSLERIENELPAFYGIAEWVYHNENPVKDWSSELRVIWFMDSIAELSFKEMLQQSLVGLDWDKYAQKYDPSSL